MIRNVTQNDATEIVEIYNYYILNTTVTFEEEPVTVEVMKERINEITEKFPWLAYEKDGQIIGYACAGAWKPRSAYKYSVETKVYLRSGLSGKGIGSELYTELLARLEEFDLHRVIGGVAIPNDSCIALHKKFGFEKAAHFKEIGFKFNKWIDVTYWEKIL